MTTTSSPWTLEEACALHNALLALGEKIAVAESLTAGRVTAELSRFSGASAYLAGGATCYSVAAKIRLLGVDPTHAAEVNAISDRVALEMAEGAARLFEATWGVATTGYAEPTRGIAAPYAWVAVVGRSRESVRRIEGGGLDRSAMQAAAAAAALRLLREQIGKP